MTERVGERVRHRGLNRIIGALSCFADWTRAVGERTFKGFREDSQHV